ncbi:MULTISPECIES: TetR family transcriptional regulator [unclassified Streptomyces]|uniref:TetR family transcriptional regulator n=1 Tax=unclassified Streptomyces TaxID=2593676 RepID=UPI002DD80358|nr:MULTISPECIES: TetR family transcriptional regulator [unclassified Streptomyces]WSA95762.1 TetR/AcrR family transcriptional regulator [Streptomyces sp. NBC_01795]WSB80182.1 TetR/AcrR family transcriptional regulator [Streptomyces sp. NBC_01775]WSS11610.1 TetR/AcrR family transcriptional regulator [Streptomyces sp. NBC_01186]WSS40325.1 TetR/AcrR family transcriptional regulator [Streptomyces sp. NBC_01187]
MAAASPSSASPSSGPLSRPSSRPSLTERRKTETEREIARHAAELFSERGAAGVTAEGIARAAGISLRTFYRYFRTKEEAVTPLLTGGVRQWLADLAAAPGDLSVEAALERAVRAALTPGGPHATAQAEALLSTRGLLRAVPGDPALRSVWLRVHAETEEALVPVLTRLAREGTDPLDLRLTAAAANTAMRIAMETWATDEVPPDDPERGPAALAVRCLRGLTAGLRTPRAQGDHSARPPKP